MTSVVAPKSHPVETDILRQAIEGDLQAANKTLKYLSSTNPHLCKIMQDAIHDLKSTKIWPRLLKCLALHRWDDHLDCERRSDPAASSRIDQAIIEAFIEDQNGWETPYKDKLLKQAMSDPEPRIRYAAAYLLGLRGDMSAIDGLSEAVISSSMTWKQRAVKALASLKDERCAPPLIQLLIEDRGELHREAGRALHSLGARARSAWESVLDHPDSHIRWHAARGLGEMGISSLALPLAEGLRDDDYVVRWATADVLARLGEAGIPATLTMLSRHPLTERFRRAAYHALHGVSSTRAQKRIKPLLEAMRGPAASIETASIAQQLLMEWTEEK